MAVSTFMLKKIQHGLEGTPGTGVAATFIHFGNGALTFDDSIQTPGFEFAAGVSGGWVEPSFIADTGSTMNWEDTDLTASDAIWLGNMGIKTSLSAASADSAFAFTFPTTGATNSISTFTHELATTAQEYEFTNGVCTNIAIHGDTGANNGRIMYNAKHEGRISGPSTVTPSLGLLLNRKELNINYSTIHFDALGTVAGTASATANLFRAFSIDLVTGWELRKYGDGRSTKDGSLAVYKNYELTGTIKLDLDTATVTRIANARAGTSEIVAIKMNGASGTSVIWALPLTWTKVSEIGANDNGLIPMTFDFRAGYSGTSTAQGPSMTVVGSAVLTVT